MTPRSLVRSQASLALLARAGPGAAEPARRRATRGKSFEPTLNATRPTWKSSGGMPRNDGEQTPPFARHEGNHWSGGSERSFGRHLVGVPRRNQLLDKRYGSRLTYESKIEEFLGAPGLVTAGTRADCSEEASGLVEGSPRTSPRRPSPRRPWPKTQPVAQLRIEGLVSRPGDR